MVKSIEILGLFGEVKNKIKIKLRKDLTILVGKNGCGKTTILNILNTILNKSFHELWKYNFNKIEIEYENEALLIKRFEKRIIVIKKNWHEILLKYNVNIDINEIEKESNFDILKNSIEDSEIRNSLFIEIIKNSDTDIYNVKYFDFDVHPLYFPTYRRTEIDFSELLWENQGISRNTKYYRDITYSRNYLNNTKFENTVVGISNKDIREIVRNEWLKVSNIETLRLNSLITDFFLTFLEIGDERKPLDLKTINTEEINNQIKQIFTRTGLARIGKKSWSSKIDNYTQLIADARLKNEEIDNKLRANGSLDKVLEHFNFINSATHSLSKVIEIINVYNDACSSIESIKSPFKDLQQILTEFMLPKKVFIEDGELYFKKGNEKLVFEDLSAGEKQLVTLFVYTSLAAQDDSIIMIDEPELSLHVTWQRNIIKNLLLNKKKIQYVISTHSPFVISGYQEYIEKIGEFDYDKFE